MTKKFRLPTEDEIRSRAYQIYLARGCEHNHADDDWLQAEYELIHLPLRKIADLEAIVVEEERVKSLKLLCLARAAMSLKKYLGKQRQPHWSPPLIYSTAGMAASA